MSESVTKGERAYVLLRRGIITGELPPESPIDEVSLAKTYGLSRTPLREALKRLAQENHLVWVPHRAPHVPAYRLQDLRQMFEARKVVEQPVARLAAERATADDIERLRGIVVRLTATWNRGDTYLAVELDRELHLAIAESAHNAFLLNAVMQLNDAALRLWYAALYEYPSATNPDDHSLIVEAIAAHNQDAAEHEIVQHIAESFRRQLELHGLIAESP